MIRRTHHAMRKGLSPRGRGSPDRRVCDGHGRGPIPAWAGEPARSASRRPLPGAYPRVGGGAAYKSATVHTHKGLSPRGRGSRRAGRAASCCVGPIPAWAGEPLPPISSHSKQRAYPRVGGGAYSESADAMADRGLSPRGRGSRPARCCRGSGVGPIPAWAGEPTPRVSMIGNSGAYPRVGGGASQTHSGYRIPSGLSPRGRGSRLQAAQFGEREGPIPAWAGEPRQRYSTHRPRRAYPRVGGGAIASSTRNKPTMGLSPRGRGSPSGVFADIARYGPIPAWAGEPKVTTASPLLMKAYPRVGGGAAALAASIAALKGLSPRGRGSPVVCRAGPLDIGPIPAWAGEPHCIAHLNSIHGAYPRVGGGAPPALHRGRSQRGLSPRGRGSLQRALSDVQQFGPIPAWAGEPTSANAKISSPRAYPRVGGGALVGCCATRSPTGLSPRGRGSHRWGRRNGR